MDAGAIGISKKRDAFFSSKPGVYALIIIFAVVLAYGGVLRTEGIFSCQADGYSSDRYLAYCNGTEFGDFEHGAWWFDLEPSARAFARAVDVIFLGDSFTQFGFSSDTTKQWFATAASSYYLLGFLYGENVVFEEKILRKLNPKAKVYVIPVHFFDRSETLPTRKLMHGFGAYLQYKVKYVWQSLHERLCQKLPIVCGHNFAVFRSRETGAYYKSGKILGLPEDSSVRYEHGIDDKKVAEYSKSGKSFLSQLSVGPDCIILTTVPTARANSAESFSPSIETSEAVAKELGVTFVPGSFDEMRTFDGSHLDQSSAERWSKAFFGVAGPRILRCITDAPKPHP